MNTEGGGMLFNNSPKAKFRKSYDAAHSRKHPELRLNAANDALMHMNAISVWPFEPRLSRRRAEGKLHAVIGTLHLMFAEQRPAAHAELAWSSCERALEFLEPGDGNAYALALMNAGIANADRRSGDVGQNLEKAITHTQHALKQMQAGAPVPDLARCHGNLSSFYSERQFGDRVENIELAIQHGTKLVELAETGGNALFRAGATAELGKFHQQRLTGDPRDNYSKSISLLERALQIGGTALVPHARAMILMDLLTAVVKHGDDGPDRMQERVDQLSQEALSLLSPIQTPEQWGVLHMRLAGILLDQQTGDVIENRSRALTHIDEALNVLDETNYPEHRKHALYLKASASATTHEVRGNTSDVSSAIDVAREALQREDYSRSPRNWIRAALSLADLLSTGRMEGRAKGIEEAIQLAETVESLVDFDEDPSVWLQATETLGNCYAIRPTGELAQNMEHSIRYLESALEKLDSAHSPKQWISVSLNLANSYEDRLTGSEADNLENAIARYEATLVVATATRYPQIRQNVLKGLSRCWGRRIRGDQVSNLREAESALTSAQQLARETRDVTAALLLENDILLLRSRIQNSSSNSSSGESSGADEDGISSEDFLARLDEKSSKIDRDRNLIGWVETRITYGDFLTRATPPGAEGTGELMDAMAVQCEKAIFAYREAQNAIDKADFPTLWARLRDRVAIASGLMATLADWRSAGFATEEERAPHLVDRGRKTNLEALEIRRAALSDGLQIYKRESMPRRHLEQAIELGKVEVELKAWANAHQCFDSASMAANALLADVEVNPMEEQKVLSKLTDLASLAPLAAIKSGNVERAIHIAESSRARLLAKSLTLEALPFSRAENEKLIGLRDQIKDQEERLNSPTLFNRAAPIRELMALRDQMRSLVTSKGFSGEIEESDVWSALEQSLEESSVLVLPFLTDYGGEVAIVFRKNGELQVHSKAIDDNGRLSRLFRLGSRDERDSWAQSYDDYAGAGRSEFRTKKWGMTVDRFSQEIGTLFSKPLLELLKIHGQDSAESLQFLSEGFLGHLPIAAGKISGTEALGDRFAIAQIPSLRVKSLAGESVESAKSIVTIAPEFRDAHKALPGAQLEAITARHRYGNARDLAASFPENLDQALSALDGVDVWHFSTHAVFDRQQPNKSYLELGDGLKLTASAILDADFRLPPELVILSACESGLYGLDSLSTEFIGLPSAFIQAGARGVLATLWPTLDKPSFLMLSKFHEVYARGDRSAARALQRAQVWLKSSTIRDFIQKVEQWASDDVEQVANYQSLLQELRAEPLDKRRYANPMYWSGVVYFGSERNR